MQSNTITNTIKYYYQYNQIQSNTVQTNVSKYYQSVCLVIHSYLISVWPVEMSWLYVNCEMRLLSNSG